MTQSRRHSLLESATSTAIGYVIAVIAAQVILPLFGFPVRIDQNLAISGLFTVISVVRSYCFRRIFNRFQKRN